jgi:hypothetical protein
MQTLGVSVEVIHCGERRRMRLNKDSIIPWECVFKIIFPNEKIYVGSDTANTAHFNFFRYFDSPLKAKNEMLIGTQHAQP